MQKLLKSLLVLSALLFHAAAVAEDQPQVADDARGVAEEVRFHDTGPLRVRDQFLYGLGFLSLEASSARSLAPGAWQVDLVQTVSNSWANSEPVEETLLLRGERSPLSLEDLRSIDDGEGNNGIFFVDGELYRASLAVRRGVSERLQIGVTVPLIRLEGGFLDGAIQDFHDAFGFDQSGRDSVPRNAIAVYVRSGEFERFVDTESSLELGDAVVSAKWQLRRNRANIIALETEAKLPTGDDSALASSGAFDVGAQLLGTRFLSRAALYYAAGATFLGNSSVLGTHEQVVFSGMLGYEHALGEKSSWIAQIMAFESPFRDLQLDGLSKASVLIDIGYKRSFSRELVMFVAVSENLVSFDATPDLGIHLGFTRTFGHQGRDD